MSVPAAPRATVADETIWNGSSIGARLRRGGLVDDVEETMRDLRHGASFYRSHHSERWR
jgi:hypothetical protein